MAKIDSQELRDLAKDGSYIPDGVTNKDGDSVTALAVKDKVWNHNFKLLTTSGTIVKNKTAAKDGADWYFYVDDKQIKMYTNNKNLNNATDSKGNVLKDAWDQKDIADGGPAAGGDVPSDWIDN